MNGTVRIGTSRYVAGGFLSMAGTKRRYFAAFDLLTGELLPWNPLPSALNEGEVDHRLRCSFGGDFDYGANTVMEEMGFRLTASKPRPKERRRASARLQACVSAHGSRTRKSSTFLGRDLF